MSRWSDVGSNVRWGLTLSAIFAVALSVFVLVLAVVRGSISYPEYNATTWTIIRTYFVAGAIAGPIVGILRPLGRRRPGAMVLGAIAGTIAYTTVGAAMDGAFTPKILYAGTILGSMIGSIVAYNVWGFDPRRTKRPNGQL